MCSMTVTYHQRFDNEWVDVTHEKAFACCACGLIQDLSHLVVVNEDESHSVLRKAVRNKKETTKYRKRKDLLCVKNKNTNTEH